MNVKSDPVGRGNITVNLKISWGEMKEKVRCEVQGRQCIYLLGCF